MTIQEGFICGMSIALWLFAVRTMLTGGGPLSVSAMIITGAITFVGGIYSLYTEAWLGAFGIALLVFAAMLFILKAPSSLEGD
jgi:hypothetical protein